MTDLIGLFVLYNLTKHIDCADIGLYRDDGLAVIHNSNGQKCDRVRKAINTVMKKLGLKTEILTNVKQVNFLDVTFNLHNNSYQPYMKDNSTPTYINTKSNHPPSIIKQIPKSIASRLSRNSSNIELFNNHSEIYDSALRKSGFKRIKMEFNPQTREPRRNKKTRKRNITWFNPPFNLQVSTNIGKIFFKLINKHFTTDNELHKIFNKNTLKLSYSCTENMEQIIKKHNSKLLKSSRHTKEATRTCNCRITSQCPLKGECLRENIVYQADISTIENPSIQKIYIGLANTSFKKRLANHTQSFSNRDYQNSTSLLTFFWNLKRENLTPFIRWKILRYASICKSLDAYCDLCLNEKLSIVRAPEISKLLNKKCEVTLNCRHRLRYLLKYN